LPRITTTALQAPAEPGRRRVEAERIAALGGVQVDGAEGRSHGIMMRLGAACGNPWKTSRS
jgi:hypothetical protein